MRNPNTYKPTLPMHDYPAPPDLLAGRVILVTGAGDGLGRAAALAYARHGASVILLGRTTAKLERVYDEIEQQGGPQPAIMPLDMAKAGMDAYQQIADAIDTAFGRLDGLLHNAAYLGVLAPLSHYSLEVWPQVMQVNLNAAVLLTRACLPLLEKSADASIVFTSDSVGRRGRAYWGAYGVSKFALEGLMQILAAELDGTTNIRVNSLDPGAVRTAQRARAYPGENPAALPAPEDVMAAYLYLMGPASAGTTGQACNAQAPRT
jgi:NAD(P)-dependent dehydrogenase (short-subunit alcohol dehydrogenase family)